MNQELRVIAESQHGVFTVRQARAAGMTRSAIRHRRDTRRWIEQLTGVFRVSGSAMTERAEVMAAVLSAGINACASGTTAAALHDIPGFSLLPAKVAIGRRPPRGREGVKESFSLPAHHVGVLHGIPVTTAPRTIFDLCGELHPARAERALDSALARKIVTIGALEAALDELAVHGRAGTVILRDLIAARHGSFVAPESELEARFLAMLVQHRVRQPDQQVVIADRDGPIGRVDFVWTDARLVIETDGAAYHDGLLDIRNDAERDRRLIRLGYRIRRYRWTDVVERSDVIVAELRDMLGRAA